MTTKNEMPQRAARKVATPWGDATLVEEATVPQRAGEKRFASMIQLLETSRGEQLVRVAYASGGVARRGPVTLKSADLRRLRAGLARCPRLLELLTAAIGEEA